MSSHYLRKYGVAVTIPFELYKLDGTGLKTDAASATGDITLYRDEGANEVLDADAFVDEGVSYSLVLSQAEMTAKHIIIHIVDQSSPQVWLDKVLIVETYGHASAEHIFDLGTATQNVNVASIDNIDFGATMKASINTEVDTALNTAIPGTPTSDSVNERVKAIDDKLPAAFATEAKQDTIIAKTNIIGASVALESGGNIAAILADTNELQTDWANGGRLDLLIDSIITNVGTVDTVVDAIKAVTDLLTLVAIADAVHDEAVEGAVTNRQSIRLILAALTGKTSEAVAGTMVIRDANDTADRITATMDANRYRTGVVLNP